MQDDLELGDLSALLRFDEPPRQAKSRRDSRLLKTFRVGKLTTDRFEELCLIRAVGAGGMMAHVHSPLAARQRVRIELNSDRRLWGNVLWIKEGTAGIGFDDQVDIEEVLARSDDEKDNRRSHGPRLAIDCRAKLRIGARFYWVRVHDLGQTGIGVISPEVVAEGTEIVVTLEGFRPLPGSAIWCRDGRVGIAFHQPIPFVDLMRWLQDMFGRTCVDTH